MSEFRRADGVFLEIGWSGGHSDALDQMGSIERLRGNLAEAQELYAEAARVSYRVGRRINGAISDVNQALVALDRGAIEDTVLEEDVRIDNLCQIGHNVRIGAHTAMAGVSGIAGSTTIGRYCLMGGRTGIAGHLEIADRTTIAAGSNVLKSILEPGTTWSAQLRARPQGEWQRNLVRMNQLDQLARKLNKLEKHLGKITEDG